MFRALEVHHQENRCKNTGIVVLYISTYVVDGESSVCGYTVVEEVLWVGE